MKTISRLIGIYWHNTPLSVKNDLQALCPEAVLDHVFVMELPDTDPRVNKVLDYLHRMGYRNMECVPPATELTYCMEYTRVYDSDDFMKLRYLDPWPEVSWGYTHVSRSQPLSFDYNKVPRNGKVGIVDGKYIILSDAGRVLMENTGLSNLVYKETVPYCKVKPSQTSRFWHLWSDVKMPPIAAPNVLINDNCKPFDGDYLHGCLLREGLEIPSLLYSPAELYYKTDDVEFIEPFDIAMSCEQFGRGFDPSPRYVVSQRFYQFCVQNKLPFIWLGVHLVSAEA